MEKNPRDDRREAALEHRLWEITVIREMAVKAVANRDYSRIPNLARAVAERGGII